jgi:TatD DNase family protein
MIIDTHAHYDDEAFDADRDALLKSLNGNGIELAVNAGREHGDFEKGTRALA